MPRKITTAEAKDQNRDSQRRSRARRKELIDELKSQVAWYQRQGVVASQEVQAAARAVRTENQRLRSLLHMHGVPDGEIHWYLSLPEDSLPRVVSPLRSDGSRCRTCGSNSLAGSGSQSFQQKQIIKSGQGRSKASRFTSSAFSTEFRPPPNFKGLKEAYDTSKEYSRPVQAIGKRGGIGNSQYSGGADEQRRQHTTAVDVELRHTSRDHSDSTVANTPNQNPKFVPNSDYSTSLPPCSSITTLQSSCDSAAAILVGLHRHTDRERARAALGCKGASDCSVKNTDIFHLMESLS